MNKALLIIDVQNDFVSGSLGSKYAQSAIVPNIKNLIPEFNRDDRFATLDTHDNNKYMETQEGKKLPVKHCIEDTEGHNIVKELNRYILNDSHHRIIKKTFGADPMELYNDFLRYDEIHICGLCTDICVVSNALILKALFPEKMIIVHGNCCGGTSKETHDAAIATMKSCQIDIV